MALPTADSQLYEDTYTITSISAAKYDRVSRLTCTTTTTHDTLMTLDINSELYPCSVGETLSVVLASTLALDGGMGGVGGDEKRAGGGGGGGAGDADTAWRDVVGRGGEANLADMFEYVCRGKIYRFEEGRGENLKVYISFGGLLMFLDGPFKKLTSLRIDYVYLLIKK